MMIIIIIIIICLHDIHFVSHIYFSLPVSMYCVRQHAFVVIKAEMIRMSKKDNKESFGGKINDVMKTVT